MELSESQANQPDHRPRDADSNRLAAGASVSLVGTMAGRGLFVVSQIVLARLLGPEAFGLYAIGFVIYRLVFLISPLGSDQGVIRYASRYRSVDPSKLKGVLAQSFGVALLSGVVVGSALYLGAPWLAEQVFKKPELTSVIRWFSPAFLMVASLKVALAATTVSQRMRYVVYADRLTQPAINLILVLVFLLAGWRLLGAVAAFVISVGVALVMALFYVRRLFPDAFSRRATAAPPSREILTFSLLASVAFVFSALNGWVDRLLVGYFLPVAEVGIYQAAAQSSILFATISGAFAAIFSPIIADLYHKGRTERLNELFKVSTKWTFYLSLPPFLVVCLAPRELILALFGAEYASGALPLVILAAGQLFGVVSGAVGLLLVMSGKQKRWLWISAPVLLQNIALNWLLIPRFGLNGAALATAFSVVTLFSLGLLQIRRHLGVWPYDLRYSKGLLAAVLTAGSLLVLRWAYTGVPVLDLALTCMISLIVFCSVLVLLGLDTEDREFIGLMRARIGNLRRDGPNNGRG